MSEWVTVYKDKDQFRVEILKNELINQGIDAVVLNKKDGIYPILGQLELKVNVLQKEMATLIITNYNSND
jgi:hypothetical protein